MYISDHFLAIISGIGALQSVLFLLLILGKKQKNLADWILMTWFLVFALHLFFGIGRRPSPASPSEILIMTVSFLHGPFFLIYTNYDKNFYPVIKDH